MYGYYLHIFVSVLNDDGKTTQKHLKNQHKPKKNLKYNAIKLTVEVFVRTFGPGGHYSLSKMGVD
jgi:hypothetical protein